MSARILSIIIVFLLCLCTSCSQLGIRIGPPEREIEKTYKQAYTMYTGLLEGRINNSQRNWLRTIRQFQQIVKDYPNSRFADDAQYNIGSCYIRSHRVLKDSPHKAINAFEYLIQHYPKSEFVDDAYYWKAHAYSLENDYKRSVEEYERFIQLYPDSRLHKDAMSRIKELQVKLGIQDTKQDKIEDQMVKPSAIERHAPDTSKPEIKKTEETAKETGRIDKEPEKITEDKKSTVEKKTETAVKETPDISEKAPEPQPRIESELLKEVVYLKGIRFNSGPKSTRVVMDLSGPVNYKAIKLENPERIYVDLHNTIIDPAKQTIKVNDELIDGIRTSQFDSNTARVVLDVRQIKDHNVFCLKKPDRLVIDVYSANGSEGRSIPLVKQLGLKVRTIVIDPGHGGKDPGAISSTGEQEKDIVLDIAKQLKDLLESKENYKVYMTRETDVYIPLERRTAFANENGADIFISIHINASKRQEAQGIETYYLSMASDEESRATAALENASSEKTINDMSNILRYILRGAKVDESRELARTIQSRLCHDTGAADRGVRRAPFIVLIGASAPSILVELGFMSSQQDIELLNSQEYRKKIAQALMEALEAYTKSIDPQTS